MSYKTAWSKSGGSLPSDRIPSRTTTPKPKSTKASRSNTPGAASPPKSKEVLRLEILRDGLQAVVSRGGVLGTDPKGGCFCQARSHVISTYNSACMQCGLPLCMLNLPNYACPSCVSPLHSEPALHALLAQVLDELDVVLRKEEDARRQAEDERKRIQGSFPTLAAATTASSDSLVNLPGGLAPPPQQQQAHKVLSLNAKTKRVTVASYTKKPRATPPPSGPGSRAESPTEWDEGLPARIHGPPREIPLPQAPARTLEARPWFNAREDVTYVDPARL
ncbi:uncharacterized protein PHACADRAFT_105524 [Phanerochaete carnosa HHB-10118-sp]|uniref:TRIP4/RQT4 C2HC5-type zinc finger domain-containing protein n=1 Tax=Phanerochaete carnosa (strain HHB-10118-sp) TaxID=650164 RepID=K5UL19_PHACS|nr:uncharacterized protein PHACADRAFT_105524 [Phanerochaete carnosa HHB-10118-sp]EKM50316.1 hypothetical protein PHACADRAFT_105524 [Phanerochaete carnosa HHB-10118-sp]